MAFNSQPKSTLLPPSENNHYQDPQVQLLHVSAIELITHRGLWINKFTEVGFTVDQAEHIVDARIAVLKRQQKYGAMHRGYDYEN